MNLNRSLLPTNARSTNRTTAAHRDGSARNRRSFSTEGPPASSPATSCLRGLAGAGGILLWIVLSAGAPSWAAQFNVPGDYATISAALDAAGDDDTIRVATGIYSVETGERFPLRLRQAITLVGDCNAPPHLQGDQQHTVVLIESGGVTVKGFRITDGMGSEGINNMDGGGLCVFVGPSETRPVRIVCCEIADNACPSDETYDGCGGGIYCGGTYCTCFRIDISDCHIHHNAVRGCGGGVSCALLSNVNIINQTRIEQNTADDHGGGVFIDVFALVNMDQTRIAANHCPGDSERPGWGGKGGGLACESFGIFTATECTVEENTARHYGGGIFTRGSLLEGEDLCGGSERRCHVSGSRIAHNRTGGSGGGAYLTASAELWFWGTTFYHNDANRVGGNGGAVCVAGGALGGGTVYVSGGCLLEGNEAAQYGGGVYLGAGATASFDSMRFLGNSALSDGGALFCETGAAVTLLAEDFEGLPLGPSIDEVSERGAEVWTKTAPASWTIDDSRVPGAGDLANDGVTEWTGWSFTDKDWWVQVAGGQWRGRFALGSGTVAVIDPDEWYDQPGVSGMLTSLLNTPEIDISGVDAGTIRVVFDSSWRPSGQQRATLTVSFDGSQPVELFQWESDATSRFHKPEAVNESVALRIHSPAGAKKMVLTFGLFDARNDWWWAIDNVRVVGNCGGAAATLDNCQVTYNNSARGTGGGIQANASSHVDLVHCSVIGNFAPRGRSGLYLGPGVTGEIRDSILWRNAGGSVDTNGARVTIATSLNEDGADSNRGVACCDPRYVGWGPLKEVTVDAAAPGPGTGTFTDPYCDLQAALDSFDFRLAADSPCAGTASDGGSMGADTGVGMTAGNITAKLHLMDGAYDIRGRNIIFIRGMQGSDPNASVIRHAVLGHIEDADIVGLSIADEEIFGGITTRADVNMVTCHVADNATLADGGGIYVAEGHCALTDTLVSHNTADGNGGGYFAFSGTKNTLVGSSVVGNVSAADGGGIHLSTDSISSILSSQVAANSAHDSGGGVHLLGQLNITDANLCDNTVDAGPGGAINTGRLSNLSVAQSRLLANRASAHGGAINSHGKLEIQGSAFESNTGTWGGALHVWEEPAGPGLCIDSSFRDNTGGDGGAFNLTNHISTVFRSCEFVDNEATGYWSGGAGICWQLGAPEFIDCRFEGNKSRRGGSVCLYNSGSHFSGCTFSRSTSTGHGGVAYICHSNISRFEDCDITDSTAEATGGAFCIADSVAPTLRDVRIADCQAASYGGAIAVHAEARPTFTEVDIHGCDAVYGGGLYARGSSLSLFQDCHFRDNRAHDPTQPPDGGGAYFTENAAGWFTRCRFQDNYAQDDGGGMGVAEQAAVILRNTLFAGNTAIDDGGGVHFTWKSTGTFTNCTLVLNESLGGTGAGIYLETDTTVRVDSSIICRNVPYGVRPDAAPTVSYSCTQKLWPGPGNRLCNDCCTLDPNTFELPDGSLCIDMGNPDPNMNDACQPPGKGAPRNDMGITGGTENAEYLIPDPNLVGWWTFDRILGTVALDSSGRGPHANLVNGPIAISGRFGKALEFDGADDYVEATINVSEDDYAVSLWFNTTSQDGGIFSVVHATTDNDRHVYLASGNLMARVYSNEVIGTAGRGYADGNWHCVVHTFGGEQGGQKLYVDGQLKASGSKGSSDFHWQTGIRVGYSVDATQPYYSGRLDEVRVYNRSLGPLDAQRLANPY